MSDDIYDGDLSCKPDNILIEKRLNGIIHNRARDRLSSCTKICKPSEISCYQAQSNDEDLIENLPTSTESQTTSKSSRICSLVLPDSNGISTFPEKNIRKKIENALAKKDDANIVTTEYKTLPENYENLIAFEDFAWFQWFNTKLEQERKEKDAKRNLELRKKNKEEKERQQKLRKSQLDKERQKAWMERKAKEDAARRERERRLELKQQKTLLQREKLEKVATKLRVQWNKKKDSERREQKQKEEEARQQKDEEKKFRALKNKQAFEAWNEKAKNKPKPMSIAIKDLKGRSDPTLAKLYWNPEPWRDLLEEPIPKQPGKKNNLIKPHST